MFMRKTAAQSRFRGFEFLAAIVLVAFSSSFESRAQLNDDQYRDQVNANTVTIMGGSLTGTYIRLADDIARSIGNGNSLRILPIKGGVVGNVRDILYLRGIDMAVVRADVLETFRGKRHYWNLSDRLNYVTTLHLEEFHLMASDPSIRSIDDLKGKVVAFHNESHVSGTLLLNRLGIKVKKAIKTTMFAGAAKTKTGEYDAIIRITGKPFRGIKRLMSLDPKLRLLPIRYRDSLVNSLYSPTEISHSDYPPLLAKGQKVETVAVKAVLGVYNWKPGTDRYRRLVKFTNAFFSNYTKILKRPGRHKKWDTINIAAKIAGWKRFPPAAEWITKWKNAREQEKSAGTKKLVARFEAFVKSKPGLVNDDFNNAKARRLFAEFMKWIKVKRNADR